MRSYLLMTLLLATGCCSSVLHDHVGQLRRNHAVYQQHVTPDSPEAEALGKALLTHLEELEEMTR